MAINIKGTKANLRSSFGPHYKLIVWTQGLIHGPKHPGGVLPLGTLEPPIAQIRSWTVGRLEHLAARWNDYRHSIPAAMRQAEIELDIARTDLQRREETLAAHIAEYKRTHNGLAPPAAGKQSLRIGFCIAAGFFVLGEMPFTGAAFERLLPTDWERLIATIGASAVMIGLAHQIGIWFARPAKTIAQRLVGLVLIMTLAGVLTGLSLVRTEAVKKRLEEPVKSTPEVHLRLRKGGLTHHA
jgi:hypothetical protein